MVVANDRDYKRQTALKNNEQRQSELRSELKNGLIMQKKAEPRRLNFRLIRKDAAQLRKEADAPDENA